MSAGGMESGWFYARRGGAAGQQAGPFSWQDLVSHARGGAFGPDDLVWHEQLGDWRPAAQVQGLFAAPVPAPVHAATPAAQPGYVAPPGYAMAQPVKKSKLLYWLLPLIAAIIVAAGLLVYFLVFYGNGDAFVQNEGEILLEPSGLAGPDSFAGEEFVVAGPTTTFKIPNPQVTLPPLVTTTTAPATTSTPTTAAAGTTVPTAASTTILVAYIGDTPALYGGSKDKLTADKEGELAFLEKNPKKAAAFCEALNSDPTLRWSGGNRVNPDQLRAYFAELTPMLLTRDTRVTNFGYKDGHPTPRQSVLQAGQLVLVDQYGVPRKRCECGNPLTPPKPSKKKPVYTGQQWPGFDPTTIIVIQSTTVIINDFTVIDIHTGEPFVRPAGTEGGDDGQGPGVETTDTTAGPVTDTTGTTIAPPITDTTGTTTGSPVSSGELNGVWSGTMTITEFDVPAEALQGAQDQGCDLSVLEALKNIPLPMEMTIAIDASGTGGTATMMIDASSLPGSEGGSSTPSSFDFTISGNTLTFEVPAESGVESAMTGTVGRSGNALVISGVMTSGAQGAGMTAEWSVTKQEAK